MKKAKCGRGVAFLAVISLLAGILGGCGKADKGAESDSGQQSGGAAAGTEKGRYVERQETLPEGLAGSQVAQMFVQEERVHLLTWKQENGKTVLQEWEQQDAGFADVTQGWLKNMDLPESELMETELAYGKDGKQYLYAGYTEDGIFMGHLWKGQGDSVEEITPEKWTVSNEDTGGFEMVQGLTALENGTLVTVSYTSVDILSGEDGSVIESEPANSFYEGSVITDGKNVYLNSGTQFEKRAEGKSGNMTSIPHPGNGSGDSSVVFGGAGSMALAVLKDGTLFAGGEDGIFRLEGGNAEGEWQKLIEGMDTDFAISDCWCLDFAALEDGTVYALFETGDGMKLNRYVFDPDAVSEVTQVLKLYTVYENSLLKQAATMYHKAHPEVMIDIETEYPMYYEGIPDYDTVYQKLNTMLMGDEAPDILVMDHLNMDSYAEKGLLENLEDVVKPLEDSGQILSNITGSYRREDGKRYVVPLQFGFNMAMGRDITKEEMGTIESLAEFLQNADYSYMGSQTVAELVDKFYPYFCDKIVKDKQLDREVMGKYLDYLKIIGDNCGIIASRPENELVYGIWELPSTAKLAFNSVGGFVACMFPMTMVDYIKGEYTAFENRFQPYMQMGLSARSKNLDTAKDFMNFALSEQVQDMDSYEGFPVNRNSIKKLAEKDRSMYSASTMISTGDGGYLEFESKPYSREVAEQLLALCEKLDRPVGEDSKIRETLVESLEGFLNGSQSREDTLYKIEESLKMYLGE